MINPNSPRQKIMERIGSEGCYLLSLVRAAELIDKCRIDAVTVYENALEKGFIGADCYIHSPAQVMESMVGGTWFVRKESASYRIKPSDVAILRFERKTLSKVWTHFVLADQDGSVYYDPYGDSRTVGQGQLVSMRIFTHL